MVVQVTKIQKLGLIKEMYEVIAGYEQLTEEQQIQFEKTHKRFYQAWGLTARKKYVVENIEKVEWDQEEQTVNVYFNNGNWWHFAKDNRWY